MSASHLVEPLTTRGLEVFYMVDPGDRDVVQQLREFDGKKLKSLGAVAA